MQFKNQSTRSALLVCVIGLVWGLGLASITSAARSGPEPSPQQDVIRLESRLTQLEQRIYTLDTSIRSLEQQSRISGATSRGVNAEDVARLQLNVQLLQQHLAEHECALAKLDERTLSAAMRDARRKSAGNDPCRLNFETPVRLSPTR